MCFRVSIQWKTSVDDQLHFWATKAKRDFWVVLLLTKHHKNWKTQKPLTSRDSISGAGDERKLLFSRKCWVDESESSIEVLYSPFLNIEISLVIVLKVLNLLIFWPSYLYFRNKPKTVLEICWDIKRVIFRGLSMRVLCAVFDVLSSEYTMKNICRRPASFLSNKSKTWFLSCTLTNKTSQKLKNSETPYFSRLYFGGWWWTKTFIF